MKFCRQLWDKEQGLRRFRGELYTDVTERLIEESVICVW